MNLKKCSILVNYRNVGLHWGRVLIVLRMIFLVVSMSSYASHAGQVTQSDLNIVKVMAGYTGGEAYFFVNKDPLNPHQCSLTRGAYRILAVDPDRSNVDQVLSILLAAQISGKKVEIQVYNDGCFNGHAVSAKPTTP